MDFEVIILVAPTMLFFVLVMFYRNYLDNPKNRTRNIAVAIGLLILGIILVELTGSIFYLALSNSLISLLIYKAITKYFVLKYKRLPIDTAYDWSPGLGADRIYNIICIFMVLFAPMGFNIWLMEMLRN